jgi:hypothetical protein
MNLRHNTNLTNSLSLYFYIESKLNVSIIDLAKQAYAMIISNVFFTSINLLYKIIYRFSKHNFIDT